MVDAGTARGALAHRSGDGSPHLEGAGVRIVGLPHVGKVILRGDPGDGSFLGAVRDALELDLPLAPNTSSETPPVSALWLGPDEWMLICAPGSEDTVAAALRDSLGDRHAAVVDVSDASTVIRVAGREARSMLAKGCPIDLHRRAFAFGDVAQTTIAKASVMLHQTADEADENGPAFDIYVARSYADYLWSWFAGALH